MGNGSGWTSVSLPSAASRLVRDAPRCNDNVALLGDNPETVTIWQREIRRCDLGKPPPNGREETFGSIPDKMLERAALLSEAPPRARLLVVASRADRDAAAHLLRNAMDDDGPDPTAQRLPDRDNVRPKVEVVPEDPVAEVTLGSLSVCGGRITSPTAPPSGPFGISTSRWQT